MIYLKLLFQAMGVILVCGLFLYARRKSSLSLNEWAVVQWMRDMDVVSQGQRWQGMRSQSVFAKSVTRKSFSGYVFDVVCVTRSGRWFMLRAETNMALLVRWEIEPLKSHEAAEFIEIDEDELDKVFKSLEWDPGLQREKPRSRKPSRAQSDGAKSRTSETSSDPSQTAKQE